MFDYVPSLLTREDHNGLLEKKGSATDGKERGARLSRKKAASPVLMHE